MDRHEGLELFGIGSGRGLPSRLLGGRIEVIWQILRIGVTNLPFRRKSSIGLRDGMLELRLSFEVGRVDHLPCPISRDAVSGIEESEAVEGTGRHRHRHRHRYRHKHKTREAAKE